MKIALLYFSSDIWWVRRATVWHLSKRLFPTPFLLATDPSWSFLPRDLCNTWSWTPLMPMLDLSVKLHNAGKIFPGMCYLHSIDCHFAQLLLSLRLQTKMLFAASAIFIVWWTDQSELFIQALIKCNCSAFIGVYWVVVFAECLLPALIGLLWLYERTFIVQLFTFILSISIVKSPDE